LLTKKIAIRFCDPDLLTKCNPWCCHKSTSTISAMITHVRTPPARKERPQKKGNMGSYALFVFAMSGWLLFFLTFLFLHPMNTSSEDTASSRGLRASLPQKLKVAPIHKDGQPRKGASTSASSSNNSDQQDYNTSRSEFDSLYKPTNKTMAACLLVNDDTIKLTEWIAYHYTVLPLSHLIVAIDPNSLMEDKIQGVLDLWKDRLQHLEVWKQDTWMTLNATSGWRQSIYKDLNATELGYQRWFHDPHSVKGRFHRHNRRQQHFTIQCMRRMKSLNASWVLHIDTDEFMTYNYLADDEDHNNFDAYRKRENDFQQKQHEQRIRDLRKRVLPIRQKLPNIGNVTIADFISHFQIPGACFHLVGLQINSRESRLAEVTRDVPPQIDARKLMTLRHRKYGEKTGRFTKAMIDVSKVNWDLLVDDQVVTIHTPIRDVCPGNGVSGSGYDYISSVFRLHHYAGTFRSFLERQNDGRRTRLQTFHLRDVDTVGENDDVRPWIKTFVNKVGIPNATELLSPLDKAYEQRDLDTVF